MWRWRGFDVFPFDPLSVDVEFREIDGVGRCMPAEHHAHQCLAYRLRLAALAINIWPGGPSPISAKHFKRDAGLSHSGMMWILPAR